MLLNVGKRKCEYFGSERERSESQRAVLSVFVYKYFSFFFFEF